MGWIDVNKQLPTETDWYLVYAPGYCGGSSSAKESVKHMLFSKYNVKTGKWSIEHGYYERPGCVEYWKILKPPSQAKEK